MKSNWSTLKKLIWLHGNPATGGSDPLITLSGSLVRFTSSKSKPFVSTEVSIVPQQDLHGQDAPYPAGGGKNKFVPNFVTETQNGITFTNNNGVINANGTLSTPLDFVCGHVTLSAGSYILNGCPSEGGSSTYRLQVTDYPVVNSLGIDSGSGVSFTLANDMEVAVRIQVRSSLSNVVFKPMIRLASVTDATFAPYSNICPISGWDAVAVQRTGKNLLPNTLPSNTINATMSASGISSATNARVFAISCTKNTDYTISQNATGIGWAIAFSNKLPSVGDSVDFRGNMTNRLSWTLNSGENTYLLINPTSDAIFADIVGTKKGMIEIGDTATDYEPYNGNTYTIQFGDTVYGGTVTINEDGSGELTVYGNEKISLKTQAFVKDNYGFDDLSFTISGVSGILACESLPIRANPEDVRDYGGICTNAQKSRCVIRILGKTAAEAESILHGTDNSVIFNLATPITISLTAQQINTLVGENNVWADSGDIEVTVYGFEP